MSDYKEQRPSALADMVELRRRLAGYRREYEAGHITFEELQRFELEAEQSFGYTSGSMGTDQELPEPEPRHLRIVPP